MSFNKIINFQHFSNFCSEASSVSWLNFDIFIYSQQPESNDKKFNGFIPIGECSNYWRFVVFLTSDYLQFVDRLEVHYSRSSGPGGQNVNCVSTKAEIRFQVASANWIPEHIRSKLIEKTKNQITKEGYLVMKSDRTRSQQLNLADALDKVRNLIFDVAESLVVHEASPASLEKHRRL